jgi:hypothetical protein
MCGVEPTHQHDYRDLAGAVGQNERVLDELSDPIERRVGDKVVRVRAIALEKISASAEMRIAAIDEICGVSGIAGTACGFGNSADTTGGIMDGAGEFLDREQSLGAPLRLNVEAVRLLTPYVCSQGTTILAAK